MQTALVIVIVAVAAIFLGRRLFNSVKKGGQTTCGCGCSGCGSKSQENCDIQR